MSFDPLHGPTPLPGNLRCRYELPTWLVYENADSIYFRQHNEM